MPEDNEELETIPSTGEPPAPSIGEDPAIKAMQASIAQMGQQMGQMAETVATVANQRTAGGPPAPSQQQQMSDLEKEMWKNPVQVADNLAQNRVAQAEQRIFAQQYPMLRDAALEKARGTDTELFDKYRSFVEAKIATLQPVLHTNPQVWIEAFNVVKGERIGEIMAARKPNSGGSDGPAAPSHRSAPTPKDPPLTVEEHKARKKLGLSEESYRAGKASFDDQESAWDKAITFEGGGRGPRKVKSA